MCTTLALMFALIALRKEVSMTNRLSIVLNRRRVELGMSWNEVSDKSRISIAHLRRVRAGKSPVTELVARGLETTLSWTPGSISKILEGGDPEEVQAPFDLPSDVSWNDLSDAAQHLWRTPGVDVTLRRALVTLLEESERH
jgi:hypothetical protein